MRYIREPKLPGYRHPGQGAAELGGSLVATVVGEGGAVAGVWDVAARGESQPDKADRDATCLSLPAAAHRAVPPASITFLFPLFSCLLEIRIS